MVGKFGTVAGRRFGKAIDDWRGKVQELVEARRRDGAEHDDLMGRLLAARDDKQQPLSHDELSDQVALLLLAGGETTSSAIF